MKTVLLICAILMSFSAMARMYRVVGPDGRVTYTDMAPQGNSTSVQEVTIPSYPEPKRRKTSVPGPKPAPSAAKREAPVSLPTNLVMYATQTCGYCKRARSYMKAKGIPYREVDVGRDKAGSAEFTRLGGRGVPLFSLGRQTLAGFSEASFEDFLRSAR